VLVTRASGPRPSLRSGPPSLRSGVVSRRFTTLGSTARTPLREPGNRPSDPSISDPRLQRARRVNQPRGGCNPNMATFICVSDALRRIYRSVRLPGPAPGLRVLLNA
jgi:hypothetical protein